MKGPELRDVNLVDAFVVDLQNLLNAMVNVATVFRYVKSEAQR